LVGSPNLPKLSGVGIIVDGRKVDHHGSLHARSPFACSLNLSLTDNIRPMPHEHHTHSHSHAHAHPHSGASSERRALWAALLTGGFMLAEVAGGLWSGSLALLADAGHMVTDTVALVMTWLAFRLSRRPEDALRTYGLDRLQILVAFANGLALFFVAIWIVIEALLRLYQPVPVLGGPMLGVAALGLGVNLVVLLILRSGGRDNLNMQGATLHVLGDLLGSVAAIIAAGVILVTGWTVADPLLSVLVAVVILRAAGWLVWRSGHILLEAAPAHLDTAAIGPDLVAQVPGVLDVHHLHAWQLTEGKPVITLHVRLTPGTDTDAALAAVRTRLHQAFGIDHATIQVEFGMCGDA
jgi:cobalt-zinc-cadmium efflux system protein